MKSLFARKDTEKEGSGPHTVGSGHLRRWAWPREDPGLLASRYLTLSSEETLLRGQAGKGPSRRPKRPPERGREPHSEGEDGRVWEPGSVLGSDTGQMMSQRWTQHCIY